MKVDTQLIRENVNFCVYLNKGLNTQEIFMMNMWVQISHSTSLKRSVILVGTKNTVS